LSAQGRTSADFFLAGGAGGGVAADCEVAAGAGDSAASAGAPPQSPSAGAPCTVIGGAGDCAATGAAPTTNVESARTDISSEAVVFFTIVSPETVDYFGYTPG
jgi:hypothetical protein